MDACENATHLPWLSRAGRGEVLSARLWFAFLSAGAYFKWKHGSTARRSWVRILGWTRCLSCMGSLQVVRLQHAVRRLQNVCVNDCVSLYSIWTGDMRDG